MITTTSIRNRIQISDIILDGNASNQSTSGNVINIEAFNDVYWNLEIPSAKEVAFRLFTDGNTPNKHWIHDCHFRGTTAALEIGALVQDTIISRVTLRCAGYTAGIGMNLLGSAITASNFVIHNVLTGVHSTRNGLILENGRIDAGTSSAGTALHIDGDAGTISAAALLSGLRMNAAGGDPPDAIHISAGDGFTVNQIQISNCMLQADSAGNSLRTSVAGSGTVSTVTAIGNRIVRAVVLGAGSGHLIRDNQGYVTEASGTGSITSGGTTDVITHGLDVTPTVDDISITFEEQADNDYGRWWVDTITSTQFTLNVSADPGASNLDFGWRAVVL